MSKKTYSALLELVQASDGTQISARGIQGHRVHISLAGKALHFVLEGPDGGFEYDWELAPDGQWKDLGRAIGPDERAINTRDPPRIKVGPQDIQAKFFLGRGVLDRLDISR